MVIDRNSTLVCAVIASTLAAACEAPRPEPEITLVVAGQALDIDPRK